MFIFFQGYCLAVYLVRRLSADILLQRLKQFGNRHSDHTRALSEFFSYYCIILKNINAPKMPINTVEPA